MFNPFNETITLLTPVVAISHAPIIETAEFDSEAAICDQLHAYRNHSYDQLVGVLISSTSEVERTAARQHILAADWEVTEGRDSTFIEADFPNSKCFGRLWDTELRNDRELFLEKGEYELANLMEDLLGKLGEGVQKADYCYAPRSAGRFAKAG